MLIKATAVFNQIRKLVIPGGITNQEFRNLQKDKEVDVNEVSGAWLIKSGYAAEIKQLRKVVKKDGI